MITRRRLLKSIEHNSYTNRGIIDGYEYVDLGLPTGLLWATCNVGANTETDYGKYYKYGYGAIEYDGSNAWYKGTESPLDPTLDTAVQVMGGSWRMPTKEDWEELINETSYQWTTIDGVAGGKFSVPNGNYVFFPAAGRKVSANNLRLVGEWATYWSSTPYVVESAYAITLKNDEEEPEIGDALFRNIGIPVRGVISNM